jgi:hypothetical protein
MLYLDRWYYSGKLYHSCSRPFFNLMSQSNDPLSALRISLRENPFFGSLPESALVFLNKRVTLNRYSPGATIFWEGESSKGLYWLYSGT